MVSDSGAVASQRLPSISAAEVFGDQLKQTRLRKAWSQERLAQQAEAFGVSLHSTAVTRIERGARKVNLEELLALSAALGVSPLHLIAPRDDAQRVTMGSQESVDAWRLRDWLRGEAPLRPTDDRRFFTMEQAYSDWSYSENEAFRSADTIRMLLRYLLRESVKVPDRAALLDDIEAVVERLQSEVRRLRRTASREAE